MYKILCLLKYSCSVVLAMIPIGRDNNASGWCYSYSSLQYIKGRLSATRLKAGPVIMPTDLYSGAVPFSECTVRKRSTFLSCTNKVL